MPKPDALTRVTGVVALGYLVVIPVVVYVGYKAVVHLREDVDQLLANQGYDLPVSENLFRRYLFGPAR